MNYRLEALSPFGALIRNTGPETSVASFETQQLRDWVAQYRLLVFRGFRMLPKQDLALFAQQLGKPLQWEFGAINELKVKKNPGNYIFTDHAVPMHWDGAFVRKIPYIILFQCIVAPRKEDFGGTTFCDTSGIVARLTPEEREKWQQISVTYTTQKVVHYGGRITQKLLSIHPVSGEEVVRYAEPVADLNPVSLDFHGLPEGDSPEAFVVGIEEKLYHPEHLYIHRWETGDLVLADNHTLLHGREAFRNPHERYIQRINILERPARKTLGRFIENSLTIRRKEFFVAELPIFLIPLLLSVDSLEAILRLDLYLGLGAVILLFNIGDMVNCYADYKLDAIYKSYLSNAVYELGRRNVKMQIALSGIGALLLTALVAFRTQQFYLLPLTIAGAFIGLQYSVGPFRFKSRGVWQLLCLWGIIFFGPMLYTAIISRGFPTVTDLLIFAFYGFHQMGIILFNTAEDYTEDKAIGLNTIIIRLGLHRALRFSASLIVLSGMGFMATLLFRMHQQQAEGWVYAPVAVFAVGWLRILHEYRPILQKLAKLEIPEAVQLVKKNGMKVPRWLKIGAYTALFPVVVLFIRNLLR